MSRFNFLSLYKERKEEHAVWPIGERFPVPVGNEIHTGFFVFVSFSCGHCIDLFPHLNELQEETEIPFLLFCAADQETIREAADHFGFSFGWEAVEFDELKSVYRVYETPYIYYIRDGVVAGSQTVDTAEEFSRFIQASAGK
ncbi:TlpA family protein disulfide reductase [Paenibacillus sp. MMS18-CY102]|uniref:TlpA family protein disulfide reductase n=1 Tax=Paenibacillus sp. MMS18-CY102 TaxID=2682849 RepID=UPI00136550A2|nr:hypothetical protein [Paenibacillus sp. MMS18-CY102]MWC28560.1 hypothetical protein [Paenibacillus sp. MMS18-CY102]